MAHARQSIRNAVVAQLMGLATTGNNVFVSRTYPLGDNKLPCLLVVCNGEQIDENNSDLERMLELQVRCIAKDTAGLDNTLDDMLAEVEVAMSQVATLGGLVSYVSAPSAINVGLDDSLEKPIGVAEIVFNVMYFTAIGNPSAAI